MSRHNAGYSLLELMISVAVIGVLTAIVLPICGSLIITSHEASTKGNLASIRSALSIYYSDTEGELPVKLEALVSTYLPRIPMKSTPPYHPDGNVVADGTPDYIAGSHSDWGYINDRADNAFGNVFVNCTHIDTRGNTWTSY